jgi:hypothetical protein
MDFGYKQPPAHATQRGRQFTSIIVVELLTVKACAAHTESQPNPSTTRAVLQAEVGRN